jgi:hypothetical protein
MYIFKYNNCFTLYFKNISFISYCLPAVNLTCWFLLSDGGVKFVDKRKSNCSNADVEKMTWTLMVRIKKSHARINTNS